jgi:hypothetical protein
MNHAAAGAELLTAMGFPAMAALVAVHMDIHVSRDAPVDDAQILYLSDKLVEDSEVMDLSQRFEAKLKKVAHDPRAAARIRRRWRAALTIQRKIERISGETIRQLIEKAGIIQRRRPCDKC